MEPAPTQATSADVRSLDYVAIGALLALAAAFVVRSWLGWAHFDVDYGREMFVPLRLAEGDVLYRDVRYLYGPFSPYLHALGYALWGPHLNVLYASGIAAVLAVVVALYATARQVASPLAATLGTALVIVDLMFFPAAPGSYNYVFPYAFPAVHAALFQLTALAAGLRLLGGGGTRAALLMGAATGLAILTKQEFALVAVATAVLALLGLALLGRATARLVLAVTLPVVLVPAVGYGALLATMPAGVLLARLRESFAVGDTMRWLIAGVPAELSTGGKLDYLARRYVDCGRWYVLVAAAVLAADLRRPRRAERLARLAVVAGVGLVVLRGVFLATPQPAPILAGRYGAFPALLGLWLVVETVLLIRARTVRRLQRWLLVATGLALLLRIPNRLMPIGYANFYLPIGILAVTFLLVDVLPRTRLARVVAVLVVLAVAVPVGRARWEAWGGPRFVLDTPRGRMRLAPDPWALGYRDALAAIAARTTPTDAIVALPTETALYFLSGRPNHLYEYGLIPPVATTPASEAAFLADLARERPALVLVSNRAQLEFGRGLFGRDYNQPVYDWIRAQYRLDDTIVREPFRIEVWVPRAPGSRGYWM